MFYLPRKMSLDKPFRKSCHFQCRQVLLLLVPLNECHEQSLTATTCIMNKFQSFCLYVPRYCSGARNTSCGLKYPCCTLKYFRKWLLSYSFNGAAQHLVHRYFRWAWVSLIYQDIFLLGLQMATFTERVTYNINIFHRKRTEQNGL